MMNRPPRQKFSLLLLMGLAAVLACDGDDPSEPSVPDLAITTEQLPAGAENEVYVGAVGATGGSGGYLWSLDGGSLPPGLTLSQGANHTARIAGTPDASGSFSFRLSVTSDDGQEARRTFTIDVEAAPEPLIIAASVLPSGTIGETYGANVSVQGGEGSYTWSLASNSLPPGLDLGATGQTATISGTPSEEGSFPFTLSVESEDGQTAERTFTITIESAAEPLSITTSTLVGGIVGDVYHANIAAEGGEGDYAWSFTGSLPNGIGLGDEGQTAALTGTPTEAGSFEFTVHVESDDGQTDAQTFTIEIGATTATLTITTTSLPDGTLGEPYNESVDAEGGDGDYAWQHVSGERPPGLAFEVEDLPENDVLITGTPETAGTYTFTLRVASDDGQTADGTFSITIQEPAPSSDVHIERLILPHAVEGGPYAATMRATGGTGSYDWSISSGTLPPGLELDGDSIYGTTTSSGSWTFTVRAESPGAASDEQTYFVQVAQYDGARYNIRPIFVVETPPSITPHLEAAIQRWEDAVVGDLQPIAVRSDYFDAEGCGGFPDAVNGGATDDLLLVVNIASIDGPGGTLAQAGPCGIRNNWLPFAGVVIFDSDDLEPISGTETLTDLIFHEIGHVLGVGTLWEYMGLLAGAGTADPRYVGPRAAAEWHALGGQGGVPVENQGGEGTADSHWREVVFDREVMTGFIEQTGVPMPFSRVSVASVQDMGYAVDYSVADGFSLSPSPGISGAAEMDRGTLGRDHVLKGPILMVDEYGARRVDIR